MMDTKTQILGVLMLTTCVVVFWRSQSNQIEKTQYCLDDNQNNENNSKLQLDLEMKDSVISSSTLIQKLKISSTTESTIKTKDNNIKNNKHIVETQSGRLEGKKLKVLGSPIFAFIGIPYAEPPIGKLRFSRSVPIKRWKGVRKATKFSFMCPHKVLAKELIPMNYINEKISEDCLTLNIWTPDIKPKKLKAVMIWIHGGAFNYNSANLHETDGRVLALYGDVVVVTVNYRVGALGFLNTQTPEAPGNMGLYDQSLALNWIKNNINRFGGDPDNLVPFGQSAGSISIGILMVMNDTKSLFSRAITASGGALLPGILYSKTVESAQKFAKLTACAQNREFKTNPKKVVNCLKKAPLDKLLEAESQVLDSSQIAFVPSPDGAFDDIDSPGNLLEDEEGNLFGHMKELLSGLVPNEGSWLIHVTSPELYQRHTFPQIKTLEETRNMFIKYSNEKIGLPPRITTLIANSLITGQETDSPINNINKLSNALGDNSITCPTIYMADEFVARNKTVYMYLFDHKSKATKFGDWQGVSHYEEVPFVFGFPLRRTKLFSKQDIELSKRIMKIWSHFAKTGQVLPQFDLIWPKYNQNESYMVLQSNQSSITKSFHERTCEIFKASFQIFN